MARLRATALSLCVLAPLCLVGEPAAADAQGLEPWDQEAVTEHAQKLHEAVRELRSAFRKDPVDVSVVPKNRAYNDWLQTLKSMEQSARQLRTRLEGGADRKGTLAVAKRMRTQVRDAQRLARQLPPDEISGARVDPVVAQINALAVYYFEGAEPIDAPGP